jgi:hypothetical protein
MENNAPKCNKEMHSICLNNAMCYLCDGERLYKRPKWMDLKDRQVKRKAEGIRKKPKEGMSFEKRVQKARNKKARENSNSSSYTRDVASRRPNSGAIWCMPGDIVTKRELIECKERGSTTSKGEKTITIQRQQLEKIKIEAYQAKRDVWYYIFGFKECDDIYLVKAYNDELEMIEQIETLKRRILDLELQIGGDQNTES